MRTTRAVGFASLALLATVFSANYAIDGPMQRWLAFYVWKFGAGKTHGGQYFNSNDVSIYYVEGMSYQIRALAKSHFVIAADSRGHGRSTDSNAPLSYSLMSDDMSKLLDHLQINRVDVVGWSDGGIIGLDLAIRRPERIKSLVAISANYDVNGIVDSPTLESEVPRVPLRYMLFAPDPGHWPVFYRKVHSMWRTQPHYTLNDLGRIKAPTLVMVGEFDIVKREHSTQLAKAIPGGREFIVEGATHTVPNDKPEIVNRQILSFLDGNNE
jgi:pimeloyl-ACP methyl ester carboxylesterase